MKACMRCTTGGLFFAVALLVGCTVGPDYKRPRVDAPAKFRTAASDPTSLNSSQSFADLGWTEVYGDPHLRNYIAEALTNNWDIKIAAARVLQAEAIARVTRSQYFPNVAAGGDLLTTRSSNIGASRFAGANRQLEYGDVFLSMPAYELDLWGRIRRANEAARARLLASEDAQRSVRQTLVAQVATSYLQLLEFDLELEIAQRTLLSRSNSLALVTLREQGGVASLQDVYQSKVLVSTAEASIANTLRLIEQTENQLNVLLGRNPGAIARGVPLVNQDLRPTVPPGLPSSLLERRPDIRASEDELVAANADIGQAKAAFFPQVTLTGLYGYQSVSLSDLFSGPSRFWQFGPSVTFPLFTGGRLRGNLALARARFDEAIATYQQTIQNAFREVSDSLIAYQRYQEFRARQTELVQANLDAVKLAHVRYQGGVTSYLEVLYNEQQLFDAELALAQAHLNELLSVVQIYRSLGGGWDMPTVGSAGAPSDTDLASGL